MGLDALPWSAGFCERRLSFWFLACARACTIMLESVYSHGSLLQITGASFFFLESELAVAVITIDPAWGFQKGIEITQLACVCYTIHSIATNYEETKSIMR